MIAIEQTSVTWTIGETVTNRVVAPSISTDSSAAKWRELERDLKEIRRFKPNWDGFESDAPDTRIVDTAIAFLRVLKVRDAVSPPFRVALSPSGSIALEWQGRGGYVQAEIVSAEEIEWAEIVEGQDPIYSTEQLGYQIARDQWGNDWPNPNEFAADTVASGSTR